MPFPCIDMTWIMQAPTVLATMGAAIATEGNQVFRYIWLTLNPYWSAGFTSRSTWIQRQSYDLIWVWLSVVILLVKDIWLGFASRTDQQDMASLITANMAAGDNIFIRRYHYCCNFPPNVSVFGFLRTRGLITLINNHSCPCTGPIPTV